MTTPTPNPLSSAEAMKALAERLERCPQIAKLNDEGHNEAWTLAHSLSDLADASDAYLKILPTLLDESLQGDELIQRVEAAAESDRDLFEHVKRGLGLAGLVAPQLGDVDARVVGKRLLGEAGLLA